MLGIFLAGGAAASSADRGYSLTSLYLPQAALGSLPHIVRIKIVRHADTTIMHYAF